MTDQPPRSDQEEARTVSSPSNAPAPTRKSPPPSAKGRRLTGQLVALSSAAVLSVYVAGYLRTAPAEAQIAAQEAKAASLVQSSSGSISASVPLPTPSSAPSPTPAPANLAPSSPTRSGDGTQAGSAAPSGSGGQSGNGASPSGNAQSGGVQSGSSAQSGNGAQRAPRAPWWVQPNDGFGEGNGFGGSNGDYPRRGFGPGSGYGDANGGEGRRIGRGSYPRRGFAPGGSGSVNPSQPGIDPSQPGVNLNPSAPNGGSDQGSTPGSTNGGSSGTTAPAPSATAVPTAPTSPPTSQTAPNAPASNNRAASTSASSASTSTPATATPAKAASQFKDGTYTGNGYSRHGGVTAQVAIKGGKIVSANVVDCTTRYPCSDIDSLPSEVVSSQGTHLDYVSGATDSSMAYAGAIEDALSQAKEDLLWQTLTSSLARRS